MNLKEYSEKVKMAKHFFNKIDDSTEYHHAMEATMANIIAALELLEEALLDD